MEIETYTLLSSASWVLTGGLRFVLAVVFVALGMTVVRRVDSGAGYVFAGAGALQFLAVCGTRGLVMVGEKFGDDGVLLTSLLAGLGIALVDLVFGASLAWVTFRLAKRASSGGGHAQRVV